VRVRVSPSAPSTQEGEPGARLFHFCNPYCTATEAVRIGGSSDSSPDPPDAMLAEYLPILIFLAVAGALGVLLLVLGYLFAPRKPDAEKLSPYECGFEAFEDTRMKFDVRYYLVAILFIVFDLEIAFLFPWAVALDAVGTVALAAMGVFLLVLVVGFVYEWKKGALEWD
jgi:NADH-quinone oxidoreductase subunit A